MEKTSQSIGNDSSTVGIYSANHKGTASNNVAIGDGIPRVVPILEDDFSKFIFACNDITLRILKVFDLETILSLRRASKALHYLISTMAYDTSSSYPFLALVAKMRFCLSDFLSLTGEKIQKVAFAIQSTGVDISSISNISGISDINIRDFQDPSKIQNLLNFKTRLILLKLIIPLKNDWFASEVWNKIYLCSSPTEKMIQEVAAIQSTSVDISSISDINISDFQDPSKIQDLLNFKTCSLLLRLTISQNNDLSAFREVLNNQDNLSQEQKWILKHINTLNLENCSAILNRSILLNASTYENLPEGVKEISIKDAAKETLLAELPHIKRLYFNPSDSKFNLTIQNCSSLREIRVGGRDFNGNGNGLPLFSSKLVLTLKDLPNLTALSIHDTIDTTKATLSFQGLPELKTLSIYRIHENYPLSLKEYPNLEAVIFSTLDSNSKPLKLLKDISKLKKVCIEFNEPGVYIKLNEPVYYRKSQKFKFDLKNLETVEELEIPELDHFALENLPELKTLRIGIADDLSALHSFPKLTSLRIDKPGPKIFKTLPKQLEKLILLQIADFDYDTETIKNLPESLKEMCFYSPAWEYFSQNIHTT